MAALSPLGMGLLILLLASYVAIPLAQPYLFASDDGQFHLYRLMEFDPLLRAGILYPRWAPDFYFGYGYPVFNYVPPLTSYAGFLLHLTGLGYIASFKLLAYLGLALSGLTAYRYARDFLSRPASLLVAVTYMYVPYHLIDLYHRGALPEYLAFLWLPLLLWSFGRLISQGGHTWLLLAALSYAGLLLTHNVTALLFTPFLVGYGGALLLRRALTAPMGSRTALFLRSGGLAAAALLLGLALSAIYWLPALGEQDYVQAERLGRFDYHEHFLPLERIISLSPVHPYGVATPTSRLTGFNLGLLQGIVTLAGALALLGLSRRLPPALRWQGGFALFLLGGGLFLATPASLWLWEHAPLLALLQFPWRTLILCAVGSAFLAGLGAEALPSRARPVAVALLGAGLILSSLVGLPPIRTDFSEGYLSPAGSAAYEGAYATLGSTASGEFLPRWVEREALGSPISAALFSGEPPSPLFPRGLPQGTVAEALENGPARFVYRLSLPQPARVTFNHAFFPGWEATMEGTSIPVEVSSPEGLLALSLPGGTHTVTLEMRTTPPRTLGASLSVLAAALALVLLLWPVRRLSLRGLSWAGFSIPKLRFPLTTAALVLPLGLVWLLGWWLFSRQVPRDTPEAETGLIQVGDVVAITGYRLGGKALRPGPLSYLEPGEELEVWVQWRPLRPEAFAEGRGLRLQVSLRTFEVVWATSAMELRLPPGSSPAASQRIDLSLPIPKGLPPQVYRLSFDMFPAGSGPSREPLPATRLAFTPVLLPRGESFGSEPLLVARRAPFPSSGAQESARQGEPVFGGALALEKAGVFAAGDTASEGPSALPSSAPTLTLAAGERLSVPLLWRSLAPINQDYGVSLRLVSGSGLFYAVRDAPLTGGFYPSSFWRPGEQVLHVGELPIPATTPPGAYTLQMVVTDEAGQPLGLGPPQPSSLTLAHIQLLPAYRPPSLAQARRGLAPADLQAAGLRLAGVSLSQRQAHPGDQLLVRLLWHSQGPMAKDLEFSLSLVDGSGRVGAELVARPGGEAYPTPRWPSGAVLLGQHLLHLDPAAPPGPYSLTLELREAGATLPLARASLRGLQVLERTRLFALPEKHVPLQETFGGQPTLRGYDLRDAAGQPLSFPSALAAGSSLKALLFWSTQVPLRESYAVSLQLLDAQGRLVAQHDGLPAKGQRPTFSWLPGEIVPDEHTLFFPPSLAPGAHSMIVVVYDPRTGARLMTPLGNDHHRLTEILLVPGGLK